MQTILGSGGAIGRELAKALIEHTNHIRLVSRNPQKVNPGDQLMSADLTKPSEVMKAVDGSSIAYLMVGLPYNIKIWESKWPPLMTNVIKACKTHQAKLVFFDNIYMYDPQSVGHMTEENPVNPSSKKGKVRAQVAQMVMDAHYKGEIESLIARSADFYGPGIKNVSMLTEMVFNPLSQGKKANCLGRMDVKHSYTYTPDAAKATALLGNTPEAFGEVWHLPTAADPPTMKEYVEQIAAELGVAPKYRVASKFLIGAMGLFMPLMKELVEMFYQYDRDYIFDSSKFENRFNLPPTNYREGIKQIVEADYRR